MFHYTHPEILPFPPVPSSLFPPLYGRHLPDTRPAPRYWQGHRRLTRRFILAFPEKELFEFSVGGMRPFAQLATEMFKMALPTLEGMSTADLELEKSPMPETREELLEHWDATTAASIGSSPWCRRPGSRRP